MTISKHLYSEQMQVDERYKFFSTMSERNFRSRASYFIEKMSVIFALVLVFTILSSAIYFGQSGVERQFEGERLFSNPFKPKYIYYLTYIYAGIILFAASLGKTRLKLDGLFLPMIVLAVMHLGWIPFASEDPITARILVLALNVVVMTICFQVIFSTIYDLGSVLRAVRWVIGGTAVLNVLVVLAPELFEYRMAVYNGRASGLYWDPNQCATFLALMIPLATYGLKKSASLLVYLIALIGIFFTFSREGVVLWFAAVFLDMLVRPGDPSVKMQKIFTNLINFSLFFIVAIGFIALIWMDLIESLRPYLNADTFSRLSGGDMGSASERVEVLSLGWNLFAEHPYFGAGYGATHVWNFPVSVHNMFILMLAEFGIVGGVWYLYFLRKIFAMPMKFGVVLGTLVTIQSMFTHSFFDLCFYMLLFVIYWRLANIVKIRN